MPDWVRTKDPVSGAHETHNRDFAESAGLTIIDEPATDSFGEPLPSKPNLSKSGPAGQKSKE